jgi:hypothetical protein
MKKILILAVALVVAFGMQSCRRSNDTIAKDYCEKLKEGLEKRDYESVEKANLALNKYCTKLTDEEIEEMMESLEKYRKELKVDSVYAECIKEMTATLDGGIVSASETSEPGDESAYGNAMPDTVRF